MKRTIEKRSFSHEYNARTQLLETHLSMFEYGNLPETVNKTYLEYFLQTEGAVAWQDRLTGDLIVTTCTLGNDLDPYGMGRDVICVTRNGKSGTFKRDETCVVGFNNISMRPCGDIFTDAQTLADIQTSIDFLIFWTRLSPLVRVSNDKLKQQVIDAFKNIKKGIPATIVNKKLLSEFGIDNDFSKDDLTQPDFADKIQYTARLYDDVLRWHMTRYGHSTNGSPKMAQQSVEEVNADMSQSMILPLSMLKARKEMIEKVNAMFGTEITVELSGAWRAEVTAYENETGEDSIDNSADDAQNIEPVEISSLPDSDPASGSDTEADDNGTTQETPENVSGNTQETPENVSGITQETPEITIVTDTVNIEETPEEKKKEDEEE